MAVYIHKRPQSYLIGTVRHTVLGMAFHMLVRSPRHECRIVKVCLTENDFTEISIHWGVYSHAILSHIVHFLKENDRKNEYVVQCISGQSPVILFRLFEQSWYKDDTDHWWMLQKLDKKNLIIMALAIIYVAFFVRPPSESMLRSIVTPSHPFLATMFHQAVTGWSNKLWKHLQFRKRTHALHIHKAPDLIPNIPR